MNGSIIRYCYVTSEIEFCEMGGLIGSIIRETGQTTSTISNNFWNLETTLATNPFNEIVGNGIIIADNFGISTSEMKLATTYLNNEWNFVDTWAINPVVNDSYPFLQFDETIENILPPININASISGMNVHLEWEILDTYSLPMGYLVYRNDVLLTPVYIIDMFYDDLVDDYGEYIYDVTALYDNEIESEPIRIMVNVDDVSELEEVNLYNIATLHSNYPNPFNPETTISFSISVASNLRVDIYNIKGQKIKTLINEPKQSGTHTITWDGSDENGKSAGSGIYFYQLTTNNFSQAKKMVLMK